MLLILLGTLPRISPGLQYLLLWPALPLIRVRFHPLLFCTVRSFLLYGLDAHICSHRLRFPPVCFSLLLYSRSQTVLYRLLCLLSQTVRT
nr:MAG TPA: hypothetical protein [Caudoviricetes sp.]